MKVARRYFSEQATTAPWQINSNATLKIQREKEAVRQRGSGKILKDFSEKYRTDTNQKTVLKNGYKKAKLVLVRRSDIKLICGANLLILSRVWSWLRMNAGGVLNTCKSNGLVLKPSDIWVSGGRVSNAWVTCLTQGDNTWKQVLIPHNRKRRMPLSWKLRWCKMDPRLISWLAG